jgi:hypothetical protein
MERHGFESLKLKSAVSCELSEVGREEFGS